MQVSYILGPGGGQLTEMSWSSNTGPVTWAHTNIAAGPVGLVATYAAATGAQAPGTVTFYADDWLGSRRLQTDYAGNNPVSCSNLPYGDALSCGTTPTEHLFTGKEHDSESGNDYFGARYYAHSMARFLSPDWSSSPEAVAYANLGNPQSLNLYSYVGNNPLIHIDADGHCWPRWLCNIDSKLKSVGLAIVSVGIYTYIHHQAKVTAEHRQELANRGVVLTDGQTITDAAHMTPGQVNSAYKQMTCAKQ
ncbi:MAG TPA: RHS repeat-associated core domain-containing protein [Terracidiphilus sp.]|nr:RHS repeat-associated core domain-containing protein [Terracidiphilus sp.]